MYNAFPTGEAAEILKTTTSEKGLIIHLENSYSKKTKDTIDLHLPPKDLSVDEQPRKANLQP